MASKKYLNHLLQHTRIIVFPLLLFLSGIIHVKLYIKLAAVLFYASYMLYKHYLFPIKVERPVLFYLLIIPVGVLSSLLNNVSTEPGYWWGVGIGTTKWLTSAAALCLLTITIKNIKQVKLYATLKAFFLLNTIVSLADLGNAMVKSQSWMPYWLYDRPHFGISTGDLIHGLSRDSSITNAALNLAGVLLFLFRKEFKWVVLCLFTAILCTSNFSMLLLLISLTAVVVLIRDRKVKVLAVVTVLCTAAMYSLLSIQNVSYANKTINNELTGISSSAHKGWTVPTSKYNSDDQSTDDTDENEAGSHYPDKETVTEDLRYLVQSGSTNTRRIDTGTARAAIHRWYGTPYDSSVLKVSGMPGKLYSLVETKNYMLSGIRPFLLGAGMGNFASNLAVKMTGIGIYGNYPAKYIYVHQDFISSHLYIWAYIFAHTAEFHSVTQMPANVYSQLGGEYGIVGLGLFFFLYVYYFLKRSYFQIQSLILTGMLLGFFFAEYWFEMISLTVLYEFIILLNVKKQEIKQKS